MAGGVSAIGQRTGALPPRIIYLGWGMALAGFAATIGLVIADPSAFRWWAIFGFLVSAIWILSVSWDMWRRPVPVGAAE